MASHSVPTIQPDSRARWDLTQVASFPGLRALAWDHDVLYASRGYSLLRGTVKATEVGWQKIAQHRPAWWRNLSASTALSFRLFRDGLHALAKLPSGHLIAAAPSAILTLPPGEREFRISHTVLRGTRPLHIAAAPNGHAFWGEYFDNPNREEVHIYASTDCGAHWEVAYTFPKGAIRHVHNIVHDPWDGGFWILTGDNGAECRIMRASCDFRNLETVLSGNQQARAVALVPTPEALYFASDTPLEANHVYRMDRRGARTVVADLHSSSIYGCSVGEGIFFSTMVEPSEVNLERSVGIYGCRDGQHWQRVLQWKKDGWPMKWFQYGNAVLPDGQNSSGLLAVSTIATDSANLGTTLWKTSPS